MKQKFAWIGLAFLFVIAPLAFSQDGTPQPCPDVEPGALGCEPVAWSRLQEPMPLPEPDAKPAVPADQHAGQSSNSPSQPQTPKQSITGIIVKQAEKYVLKVGDNTTYQLDDQSRVAQYQDKAGQSTTPGQTSSPRNTNPAPGTAAPTPGTAAPTPGTAAPTPGTASPKPGTAPNTNGSTQQSPNDTPTPGTTSPGSETPGATTPPPEQPVPNSQSPNNQPPNNQPPNNGTNGSPTPPPSN